MNQARKGTLYIISGPSGAGKGTLVDCLLKAIPDIWVSVSATTRSPRLGEIEGKSYFFVSRDEFEEYIDENMLLEWSEHFSNYYGTPLIPVKEKLEEGRDVILEIDVVGAAQVKEHMPEAVLIFVTAPDIDTLLERLQIRGSEDRKKCEERIKRVETELSYKNSYNHVIVNDDLDRASAELISIVSNKEF